MRVICDDNASAELRNRCASLVLSPRSFRKPNDPNQARTISELDEYCRSYLHQLPWQVSRAIALALANRANHPDRLIEYLQWISEKPEIIEENLRESDIYYSSKDDAIAYYKSRLRNRDVPLGGCIWEIFYILHRGQGEDRRFIEGIHERAVKGGRRERRENFPGIYCEVVEALEQMNCRALGRDQRSSGISVAVCDPREFPLLRPENEGNLIYIPLREPLPFTPAFVVDAIGNNFLVAACPAPKCKVSADVAFSGKHDCPR